MQTSREQKKDLFTDTQNKVPIVDCSSL